MGILRRYFTFRIDSELWKCPIFVGSFPNLSDSWQRNKYTGLISVERRSFSWMCNLLLESWMDFNIQYRYPNSPPPSWSPPHAQVHPPPDCSVTIFNGNEQIEENITIQQSTVYQIFGRTSPNRIHRKLLLKRLKTLSVSQSPVYLN